MSRHSDKGAVEFRSGSGHGAKDADEENVRMPMMSSEGGTYSGRKSNYVERFTLFFGVLALALLVVILGVVSATNKSQAEGFDKVNKATVTSTVALGLPGYSSLSWSDVLSAGRAAQVVNVCIDSTSFKMQRWFTYVAVPTVLAQYGITLNLDFSKLTAGYVQQIETEVAAGKTTTGGSVDIFWGNGALSNYYRAKTGGVIPGKTSPDWGSADSTLGNILYGPWANVVPSAANYDWASATIAFDMGTPNEGYEMPMWASNFNLIYRTDRGITPPQTFRDLVVLLNTPACPSATAACAPGSYGLKGVFTYWNPSSYITAAFTRQFLYENCVTTLSNTLDYTTYTAATTCKNDYIKYVGSYNPALYQANVQYAFQQLRFLESGFNGASAPPNSKANLYGNAYCASQSACNGLYQSGRIYATMDVNAPNAGSNCADTTGTGNSSWGNSAVSTANLCTNTMAHIPPTSGTISNNNFMMIPKNAQNKLGAIVVGNWLGSMDAQYSRRYGVQADVTYKATDGGIHVLNRWIGNFDLNSAAYTGSTGGAAWKMAYDYLASYIYYKQTPAIQFLRPPYALPEIDSRYQTQMVADWKSCMGLTATPGSAYPFVPTICP